MSASSSLTLLCFVYFIIFRILYNLTLKMQEIVFQGLYISNIFWGGMPPDHPRSVLRLHPVFPLSRKFPFSRKFWPKKDVSRKKKESRKSKEFLKILRKFKEFLNQLKCFEDSFRNLSLILNYITFLCS